MEHRVLQCHACHTRRRCSRSRGVTVQEADPSGEAVRQPALTSTKPRTERIQTGAGPEVREDAARAGAKVEKASERR